LLLRWTMVVTLVRIGFMNRYLKHIDALLRKHLNQTFSEFVISVKMKYFGYKKI
jgi:hypothetical protein